MPDPTLREGGRMQSGSKTGVPRTLSKCSLHLPDCSFTLPSLIATCNSTGETASEKPRLSPSTHPCSSLQWRLLLARIW